MLLVGPVNGTYVSPIFYTTLELLHTVPFKNGTLRSVYVSALSVH